MARHLAILHCPSSSMQPPYIPTQQTMPIQCLAYQWSLTLGADRKSVIPGDIRVTAERWTTSELVSKVTAEGHRGVNSP